VAGAHFLARPAPQFQDHRPRHKSLPIIPTEATCSNSEMISDNPECIAAIKESTIQEDITLTSGDAKAQPEDLAVVDLRRGVCRSC
jgi:hypothetical protein